MVKSNFRGILNDPWNPTALAKNLIFHGKKNYAINILVLDLTNRIGLFIQLPSQSRMFPCEFNPKPKLRHSLSLIF